MAATRALHVRCQTWDQVEAFHTRKLRRGNRLSMKVPFEAEVGAPITLGLELPNQVVVAIDGVIQRASTIEGDTKMWIEVELTGLTGGVIDRIRAMAATASASIVAPPPAARPATTPPAARARTASHVGEELAGEEKPLFQQLTAELRQLRQLAVHEVLGVARDADADAIRDGWTQLIRRYHPDLVARHGSPAITHLAEELTILCNRAYDRLRAAMVLEGRATAIGPALQPPTGWLVGFEDIPSVDHTPRPKPVPAAVARPAPPPPPPSSPVPSAAQGSDAFEHRARAMLADGEATKAQEVLAAALVVYPRSRPLRSLYYVSSALIALDRGEVVLATAQLETALAHHDQCPEAAAILDHVKRHGAERAAEVRRLFQ